MSETKIGDITHYFSDISVAVLEVNRMVRVGDTIRIAGSSTDFHQEIESMEIDHEDVEKAEPGQAVAVKVKNRVREDDEVFRVDDVREMLQNRCPE